MMMRLWMMMIDDIDDSRKSRVFKILSMFFVPTLVARLTSRLLCTSVFKCPRIDNDFVSTPEGIKCWDDRLIFD